MRNFVALVVVATVFAQVNGHGAMWDPPNRSSMWRFGFNTPPNYDDNSNYCGGVGVQWGNNGGKCGLCGDPFNSPTPRPNENGGTYGTSTIAATYQANSVIPINIHLSASHLGDFQFDICNLDNSPESEECFKPVLFADGSSKFTDIPAPQDYHLQLKLPEGLRCKQCSLRWNYRTGNTYGPCGDGTSALGCGPQETFKNCADITIQ